MSEMVFLSTLDRLKPYDQPESPSPKQAFGLTLQTALGAHERFDRKRHERFLQPWTWTAMPRRVVLIALDKDGRPTGETDIVTLQGYDEAQKEIRTTEPAHEHWHEKLRDRFNKLAEISVGARKSTIQPRWGWSQSDREAEVGGEIHPWPAFLGELSLLPWPLPQSLGLSHVFYTEKLGDATHLAAAPILPAGFFPDEPSELWPVPCDAGGGALHCVYFERSGDGKPGRDGVLSRLSVSAEAQAVELAVPSSSGKTYFDFETLWIKNPDNRHHVFRDEWRSALEDRLAAGVHLTAVLVEIVEKALADAHATGDTALPRLLGDRRSTLARVGVGLLANMHGPGIRDGAPGGRLVDRVLPGASARSMATWFYGSDALRFEPGTVSAELERWARRVGDLTGDRSAELLLEGPETLTVEEVLTRLRSLDATLAERATAEKLFDQHWSDFWTAKKLSRVERKVKGTDWRRQLLLDHLGLVWRKLIESLKDCKNPADRGCLRRSLQRPMQTFAIEHLDNALPDQLHARVSEHLEKIVERAIPDPDVDLTDPEQDGRARGRTRGLTFQVDTPMPDPEDGTDYLERIQGFGVMMRRAGEKGCDWLSLNVGQAVLAGDNGSEEVLAERVLVPSRLGYHNDLRQVGLTYDNEPLGLESPLMRASGTYLACEDEVAAWKETFLKPTVHFKASAKNKIPALAYGAEYQIQPFLVANNGAVPKALVEGDGKLLPWKLRESFLALGPSPKKVSCKRRQRVGPLRPAAVRNNGEVDPGRFTVPEIPDGVALRARELSRPPEGSAENGAKEKVLAIEQGDPAHRHFADDVPCLLLVPKGVARRDVTTKQTFDFAVRPPAVDLQTWDRLLALDAIGESEEAKTARRRRRRVWAGVYEASILNTPEKESEDEGSEVVRKIDASLDDPAVKDVQVQLWRVDEAGKMLRVGEPVPFGWEPLSGDETQPPKPPEDSREGYFLREHRKETKVRIEIGGEARLKRVSKDGEFSTVVSVKAGELYLLTLRAQLDVGLQDRFEDGIEGFPPLGDGFTSPWHLAIEVADALVTKDNGPELQSWLWEHLQPSPDAARNGRLRVELDGFDLSADKGEPPELLARHASRAELRHQSWGWRGRPPSPHPAFWRSFKPPASSEMELGIYLPWELANLGDRHDFERRRVDMLRRRPEKEGSDPTAAIEPPFFVFDERLESGGLLDLRAGHHRFGVEVWSRYAPVLAPEKASVEARDVALPEGQPRSRHPWRSLFVPCRFHGEVPTPKVRLILPLTDHRDVMEGDHDRGAPGWLVVLDEIWFETGGLAEELRVEVARVISPIVEYGAKGEAPNPEICDTQPTRKDCSYLQMGPDPIVTGANALDLVTEGGPTGGSAPPYKALDHAAFKVEFDRIHGPVGHHRDFSDTLPRFLASSFVVRPPKIWNKLAKTEKPLADPAFWLYQVRLKRRLEDADGEYLESQPTAPFWIQLLPSLQRLDDDWLGTSIEVALAEMKDGKPHVTFERPVRDRPQKRLGFELYAVLTRLVADVTGSRDQEAYVGVYGPIDADGFAIDAEDMPLDVLPSAARDGVLSPFRIRLVEIQRPEQEGEARKGQAKDLWKRLFDVRVGERERARMTRVSQPIEVRRS